MKGLIPCFAIAIVFKILTCQTIAWDDNSLSRPVITRNHRRLKGFNFKTFHSASLVTCGLLCQRNPRCVSTNFRKVSSLDETKGVCELNERSALMPFDEKMLERDEGSIYTQFYDIKHDCQLTGCLTGGSCNFSQQSKTFNCYCKETWCGNYYGVCPVALGMESGAILDSQISASTVYNSDHAAHQARLHFKRNGHRRGGWSSKVNDKHQWIQLDLKKTTRVIRIATQGRYGWTPGQWVTKFKLQYGEDGHYFKFYRRIGDHSDTVFQGNTDRGTVVYNELENPIIEARYIRFCPTEWHNHISMRIELYTC